MSTYKIEDDSSDNIEDDIAAAFHLRPVKTFLENSTKEGEVSNQQSSLDGQQDSQTQGQTNEQLKGRRNLSDESSLFKDPTMNKRDLEIVNDEDLNILPCIHFPSMEKDEHKIISEKEAFEIRPNAIEFSAETNKDSAEISLINNLETDLIFKVRCSRPVEFRVLPFKGVLPAKRKITLKIAPASDAWMEWTTTKTVKFSVSVVPVKGCPTAGQQQIIWEETPPKEINTKILLLQLRGRTSHLKSMCGCSKRLNANENYNLQENVNCWTFRLQVCKFRADGCVGSFALIALLCIGAISILAAYLAIRLMLLSKNYDSILNEQYSRSGDFNIESNHCSEQEKHYLLCK